jgi:hypothetical protein
LSLLERRRKRRQGRRKVDVGMRDVGGDDLGFGDY